MAITTCPSCGQPLAPGARFCSHCGYTLPASAPPPAAPQAPSAPPPQAPAAYPQPATAYPPAQYPAQYPPAQYPPQYPQQQYPAAYPQGAYPVRPAYAYPMAQGYYVAQQVPRKTGRSPMWALVVAGVLAFMVVLGSIAVIAGPAHAQTGKCTGGACPKPPKLSPPVGAPHVYTSTKYGFQVGYYDQISALKVAVQDDHQIGWSATSKTGLVFPITIAGQDAGSQSADSIVESVQKSKYPDAQKVYAIPGLQLGFQNGSGNVYDVNIKSATGTSVQGRLMIAAAVKNGVAITVVALGPYKLTSPDDGHPNPSDTPLAGIVDDLVSNIAFKGDTPL